MTRAGTYRREPERLAAWETEGESWWPSWLPQFPWAPSTPAAPPAPVAAPAPAPSSPPSRYFKDDPVLTGARLAPASPITIDGKWPQTRRDLAGAYNRLGGLMHALAGRTGVDVRAVLAVWQVESAGRIHTPGRAIIRFENHVFWDQWGQSHAATFDQYFKFGGRAGQPGSRWENHQFRESTSATFETSHPKTNQQAVEYRALNLAIKLAGDEPAIMSISLGGPQVMGFNHGLLGYAQASDMFDNFQADERWHVLGFFDFCKTQNILTPLARLLWTDFAKVYNGSGQAATYGANLKAAYDQAVLLPIAAANPGSAPQPPSGSSTPMTPSTPAVGSSATTVTVNSGVVVSANGVAVLKAILASAGLRSATITSGRRSSADQARVMFDLIRGKGVTYAKNLYGSSGDKVIDVYVAGNAAGKSSDQIKLDMQTKIVELGPANVSHHCSDRYDVIDVAPSSIANQGAFTRALDAALASGQISKYIAPPGDPAFHIEILLAGGESEVARRILRAPPMRTGGPRRPSGRRPGPVRRPRLPVIPPAMSNILTAPPLPAPAIAGDAPTEDAPEDVSVDGSADEESPRHVCIEGVCRHTRVRLPAWLRG